MFFTTNPEVLAVVKVPELVVLIPCPETEAKDVSEQIESDAKILADSLQRDIERQAEGVAQAAENTVNKIFNALSKFGL